MSNFREYSARLETIGGMRRVTSTMKMVSSSRLHRAQADLKLPDPFRAALRAQWPLLNRLDFAGHRVCQRPPRQNSQALLVIITSNRGLCGPFNHSIIRIVREWLTQRHATHQLHARALYLGMKGYQALHQEIPACMPPISTSSHPKPADIKKICACLVHGFLDKTYDEVWIMSNRFNAASDIRPDLRRLLPLRPDRIRTAMQESQEEVEAILEPHDKRLIDAVLSQWMHLDIYTALLHSIAGEHASRVIAMENATFNLSNMGTEMMLLRNRARQAAITNELNEIVSGAETLE